MQDKPTKKVGKAHDLIFFPGNSLHNIYRKHLKFQRHAIYTKKSKLSPRDHTLLLRGTLGNRFWRPSSHPSSFPYSVTQVTAKVCRKSDTCSGSHMPIKPLLIFYSMGVYALLETWIHEWVQDRQSLCCLLFRKTEGHP